MNQFGIFKGWLSQSLFISFICVQLYSNILESPTDKSISKNFLEIFSQTLGNLFRRIIIVINKIHKKSTRQKPESRSTLID